LPAGGGHGCFWRVRRCEYCCNIRGKIREIATLLGQAVMEMHSPFDFLIKQTFPGVAQALIAHLLGRNVVALHAQEQEYPLVVSRRYCDFVFRAQLDDERNIVVHIEVWLNDKPEIPQRLQEYQVALSKAYDTFPVQIVLFIDEGAEAYRNGAQIHNGLGELCSLIPVRAFDLPRIPVSVFSDLNSPRDLILSLFMDRTGLSDRALQQKFAENVNKFSEEELVFLLAAAEHALRKKLISPQLSEGLILKIMETVTNVNFLDHLLTIPIVKDSVGANLREKLEKSEKEGIKKGIKKGIEKERQKFIHSLFKRGTPPDEIAQIAEVSLEYVQSVLASENGTH
jgi:hypothetical protein